MKRRYVFGAVAAVLLLAAILYLYGGGHTPAGQPALQSVTPQSVGVIKSAFNTAKGEVRVLLLLSPT
jgi:hypothetical protein